MAIPWQRDMWHSRGQFQGNTMAAACGGAVNVLGRSRLCPSTFVVVHDTAFMALPLGRHESMDFPGTAMAVTYQDFFHGTFMGLRWGGERGGGHGTAVMTMP